MINLTRFDDFITPEPGIYYDVPDDDYRKWNAFSKSLVKPALKTGEHLRAYIDGHRKTQSMHFGSLVDCMVLEPKEFDKRYALQPSTYDKEETRGRGANKETYTVTKPWNMNSNTCKEIASRLMESGKEIISSYDYERAILCRDSIMGNDEIRRSVENGKKQVSIVWNEPHTGVLCKGRPDILGNHIDDLKCTEDASEESFSRIAGNFLYHVQAAAYQDGIQILTGEKKRFRFFVCETGGTTPTPLTRIFEFGGRDVEQENGDLLFVPDNDSLLAGRLMFMRACQRIVQYEKYGFHGYPRFPEPFSVPQYVINKELALHEGELDI
jgi:exodeoxyribonuclease VIII